MDHQGENKWEMSSPKQTSCEDDKNCMLSISLPSRDAWRATRVDGGLRPTRLNLRRPKNVSDYTAVQLRIYMYKTHLSVVRKMAISIDT